jgi:hypothetical protein
MTNKLDAWFRKADSGPSVELFDRTLSKIARLERRRFLAHQLALPFVGLIASATVAAYAIYATWDGAMRSGIGEFLQTAAADWHGALAAWQDIGLSIIETLPVAQLTLACAAVFAFLWMIRRIDRLMGPTVNLKGHLKGV